MLCLCILLCVTAGLTASAVTLADGKDALMAQFPNGECPGEFDYTYYSPVKGSSDNTRYPLVIWLHGNASGNDQRQPLYKYDFSNWSSEEYQSRFEDAGGAFLMLPRSTTDNSMWYPNQTQSLKKTIDYLIAQYKGNVDMSRIYIMGYSLGGAMAYYMAADYPDFFAAVVPICAVHPVTTVELNTLKDTSVWFFASTQDYYPSANYTTVSGSFSYLKSVTSRPSGVRLTKVTEAMLIDGSFDNVHHIWDCVIYDMHMKTGEQYLHTETVDAAGNTLTFNTPDTGVISWLSQQRNEELTDSGIFGKIIAFFRMLLSYIKAIFG